MLASAAEPANPTQNYTGMNTWFGYSERPFVDLMHAAGGQSGEKVVVLNDANSIPVSDFIRAWPTGSSASYTDPHQTTWVDHQLRVNGTYNISFIGQAKISVPYAGPFSITGQHWDQSSNTTTGTLTVAYPDDSQVPKRITLAFTQTQRTSNSGTNTGIHGVTVTYPSSVVVDNPILTIPSGGWTSFTGDRPITDANGWPLSDFIADFTGDASKTSTGSYTLGGTYTLIFNGKAVVTPQFGGFTVSTPTYSGATTNTSTATVSIGGGISTINLVFAQTQRTSTSGTNTGVTNVQLYRSGYPTDGSAMFSTEYKNIMAKTDVIRFMDWGETNFNPVVSWADRTHVASVWNPPLYTVDANGLPQFGNGGVPYEVMVRLCNEINSDLYVCVPTRADDTYITNLANLIKYGSDGVNPYTSTQGSPVYAPLNSNLNIYVEYGNEDWNSKFQTFTNVRNTAETITKSGTVAINADGTTDLNQLQFRWVAYRAWQVSKLFRAVFGDSAMPFTATNPAKPRVRPLLEGQEAGPYLQPGAQGIAGLKFLNTLCGTVSTYNSTVHPLSYYFYGGGGAAYYGIAGVGDNTTPTADAVFSRGPGNYVSSALPLSFYVDSLWFRNFGLNHVAYEGGLGLPNVTQTSTWTESAEWAVDTDSRAAEMEQEFQDTWTQSGGGLLNYYSHGGMGGDSEWGFTPFFDDRTNSGKLQGLLNIRASTRPEVVTQAVVIAGSPTTSVSGTALIYTLNTTGTSQYIESGYTFYSATPEPVTNGIDSSTGEWVAFGVDAPMAATYNTTIRYVSSGANLQVYVNGIAQGSPLVCANTSGTMQNLTGTLTLPAGFSAIRLKPTTGGIGIATEIFTLPDVTNGLMARWNFDSNATDTFSAGTIADNGTLVGSPTFVTGNPVGSAALNLNGTGQYMTVPTSADVNLTTACTLAAWVKIASTTDNSYRMIFSKKSAYTDNTGYELFYHPVLHQLLLRSGGPSTTYSVTLPLTLDTNWHHLAVTINGSVATFYLDGTAQIGATGTVGNPLTGTQALAIGRRSGTTADYPWNGQLDDVRIYNRALSTQEIDTIFIQEH